MKYRWGLFIFLCFTIFLVNSQGRLDPIDSVLVLLKEYRVLEAENRLEKIEEARLKILLSNEIIYLTQGVLPPVYDNEVLRGLGERETRIAKYLYANALDLNETRQDSLIFQLYSGALQGSISNKDTLVVNEIYRQLHWHLFRNSKELETLGKYVEQSIQFIRDDIDRYHVQYYKVGLKMLKDENSTLADMNTKWYSENFEKCSKMTPNTYYLARLFQLQAIYYSSYLNDFEAAALYHQKALTNFESNDFFIFDKGAKSILFNMGVAHFHKKEFNKAVPIFKKDLTTQKNELYRLYGYDWLYKSYDALKEHDSAYFYFKKMVETKDNLDRLKHARDIKRIEGEFDLTQKEKELSQLAKEKTTIENKFFTLLPVIGLLTLISVIVFFLYKRYKNKSTVLQEEKSETLQKLDELKNIVIKNHITLKDKTKVYISDLMYIKSDDHYLNVYTSDDKNHFVRGKLSQIKEELPPNFIQCHRSYIVNSNFIKRINNESITLVDKTTLPLSRSYKKKF